MRYKSVIPVELNYAFREWLIDSYGEVESETKMAPENQEETEREFLEDWRELESNQTVSS